MRPWVPNSWATAAWLRTTLQWIMDIPNITHLGRFLIYSFYLHALTKSPTFLVLRKWHLHVLGPGVTNLGIINAPSPLSLSTMTNFLHTGFDGDHIIGRLHPHFSIITLARHCSPLCAKTSTQSSSFTLLKNWPGSFRKMWLKPYHNSPPSLPVTSCGEILHSTHVAHCLIQKFRNLSWLL